MLGCSDIKMRVSDTIFNNSLSIGDVKIGEDMILSKIGIEWLVIAIFLSIGIRCVLLSTFFMQSIMILCLLLNGRAKFSPNCKKHCMSIGMSKEDKLRNHPSLVVDKEDDPCEGKESRCMEIKELGDKVRDGLLTYNVSF